MALPERDESGGHSFGLEIDGVLIDQISEVSGLKVEQDVVELKQNTSDGKYIIKKLPGRPQAGEVTLTRRLAGDTSFEKWIKDTRFGKGDGGRQNGAIIVYDHEGNAIKRYKLTNCWPKSLEVDSLKSDDPNVLTEKLVIVHEGLDVE
jgi:phage tail-like protein